jgi:two-component system sensor histidine kinase BarA
MDTGARRVLIVDDNRVNRLAYQHLLQQAGFEASVTASGQEALDVTLHERFDLILLDVRMPIMNGVDTAVQLRNRAPTESVPLVFMSAFDIDEEANRIIVGMDRSSLVTAVGEGELVRVVQRMLGMEVHR